MTRHTTELLTGTFPAIATPFGRDGAIDHDQLRADATRLESAGVDGIVPAGSTGESSTLSHDEHVEVIETVLDATDVPVIAGTGSNNTAEALSLSRRAADAGADALLLISPYYNKPEPEGIEAYFRRIADEIDLPQIVYNVPSRTGRSVEVDTTVSLAEHENIAGYKAASGDLGLISEIVERTRDAEFAVLSGDDPLTLPLVGVGARGVISVAANVEPRRVVSLVEAALEGDIETARALHHELGPLFRALFAETNPIPVKEALSMRGHGAPTVRDPLTRLSDSHRDALESVLDQLDSASQSTALEEAQ